MPKNRKPTRAQLAEAKRLAGDDDTVTLPREMFEELVAEARFYASLLSNPDDATYVLASGRTFDTVSADAAEVWVSGAGVPTSVELEDGTEIDYVAGYRNARRESEVA